MQPLIRQVAFGQQALRRDSCKRGRVRLREQNPPSPRRVPGLFAVGVRRDAFTQGLDHRQALSTAGLVSRDEIGQRIQQFVDGGVFAPPVSTQHRAGPQPLPFRFVPVVCGARQARP